MIARLAWLALVAACGTTARPADPLANRGAGPPAPPPKSRTLAGPFTDEAQIWKCLNETDERRKIVPRATMVLENGLRVGFDELRVRSTAATCAATIRTRDGIYLGPDFLCEAFRSDERMSVDHVSIIGDRSTATIKFRSSYSQEIGGGTNRWLPPELRDHVIRCTYGGAAPPECTEPAPSSQRYPPHRCDAP